MSGVPGATAAPVEVYDGTVSHARSSPARHAFTYPLSMLLLDVDALPRAFAGWWPLAGVNTSWAAVAVREADHLVGRRAPGQPLGDALRAVVAAATGARPPARAHVALLTHPAYFGYCFNPISIYYVRDGGPAAPVTTVVAEVTNTPWNEQTVYVLARGAPGVRRAWVTLGARVVEGDGAGAAGEGDGDGATTGGVDELVEEEEGGEGGSRGGAVAAGSAAPPPRRLLRYVWEKSLHVSPFMSMDHDYAWAFSEPADALTTDSVNTRRADGARLLTTALRLRRAPAPLTRRELAWRVLAAAPLLTWRVQVWIHREAVALLRKGVELHPHPEGAAPPLVRAIGAVYAAGVAVAGGAMRVLRALGLAAAARPPGGPEPAAAAAAAAAGAPPAPPTSDAAAATARATGGEESR